MSWGLFIQHTILGTHFWSGNIKTDTWWTLPSTKFSLSTVRKSVWEKGVLELQLLTRKSGAWITTVKSLSKSLRNQWLIALKCETDWYRIRPAIKLSRPLMTSTWLTKTPLISASLSWGEPWWLRQVSARLSLCPSWPTSDLRPQRASSFSGGWRLTVPRAARLSPMTAPSVSKTVLPLLYQRQSGDRSVSLVRHHQISDWKNEIKIVLQDWVVTRRTWP